MKREKEHARRREKIKEAGYVEFGEEPEGQQEIKRNEDGTTEIVDIPRVGHVDFQEYKPTAPSMSYLLDMIMNIHF